MNYPERALVGLAPAVAATIYVAGAGGEVLLVSSLAGAASGELAVRRLRARWSREPPVSGLLAGTVLALLLPLTTPWWAAFAGGLFASGVVEGGFGGRGNAVFHPGVTGWLFVSMAWGASATGSTGFQPILNLGAASMVEVSPLLVGLGGLYPVAREPSLASGAAGLGAALLVGPMLGVPVSPAAGAGILFGIFVVTDPDYSPSSRWGRLLFGAGCGGLALLYGSRGRLLEGLVLSTVLMNAVSPWIDRLPFSGQGDVGGDPGVEG